MKGIILCVVLSVIFAVAVAEGEGVSRRSEDWTRLTLRQTKGFKACRKSGRGANDCDFKAYSSTLKLAKASPLFRNCLASKKEFQIIVRSADPQAALEVDQFFDSDDSDRTDSNDEIDELISEWENEGRKKKKKSKCKKACKKRVKKLLQHLRACRTSAAGANAAEDAMTRALRAQGIHVDSDTHIKNENKRIAAHNAKVDHFHSRQKEAQKIWASRQKAANAKWRSFHRRQAREWRKIPQLIQWTPHVRKVVDAMVNRRFKRYIRFFIKFYLNSSPYLNISERTASHLKTLPGRRSLNNGKWFEPIPRGFGVKKRNRRISIKKRARKQRNRRL